MDLKAHMLTGWVYMGIKQLVTHALPLSSSSQHSSFSLLGGTRQAIYSFLWLPENLVSSKVYLPYVPRVSIPQIKPAYTIIPDPQIVLDPNLFLCFMCC